MAVIRKVGKEIVTWASETGLEVCIVVVSLVPTWRSEIAAIRTLVALPVPRKGLGGLTGAFGGIGC